jgi:hypothetical protein
MNGEKMKMPAIQLLAIFLLNGCGELSYKQGASVKDLETTKRECRLSSEQDLDACLKQNGWMVQKLDHLDILVEDVTSPLPSTQENTEVATAKVEEEVSIYVSSNNQTLKTEKPAPIEKKTAEKPSDPLDTFKISSWWKIGSNDQHFRQDANQCQTSLDAAHAPNTQTQTYTRAFISCMQSHGWKALKVAQ